MNAPLTLTRSLWRDADALHRAADALFGHAALAADPARPAVEYDAHDTGWTLRVALPGVSPEALEIAWEGDTLVVQASAPPADEDGWTTVRRERPAWSLARRLRFAHSVDAQRIAARLEDGVLTIDVPRRAALRIPVQVVA